MILLKKIYESIFKKGRNGINKFVPFRRKMSSMKYRNNGMETLSHPTLFHSTPLYFVGFKKSKYSLTVGIRIKYNQILFFLH